MSVVSRRTVALVAAVMCLLLVTSAVLAARGTFSAAAKLVDSSVGSRASALAAGPGFLLPAGAVGCAGSNFVTGSSCFAPQVQFTWTEKGVGSNPTYVGGATLWALFECYNNGTNLPQSTLKAAISNATTSKSFAPSRNGVVQVDAGQFLVPEQAVDLSSVTAPGFSCPNPNYTMHVTFDHYEGLFLSDTATGAVATGLPARLP